MWSVGTGDYRVLARWLPGVHRAGICRCDYRCVDCSIAGSAGTLSGANRNYQLSNYLVDYRFGAVRRTDRFTYQTPYIGSAEDRSHACRSANLDDQFKDSES